MYLDVKLKLRSASRGPDGYVVFAPATPEMIEAVREGLLAHCDDRRWLCAGNFSTDGVDVAISRIDDKSWPLEGTAEVLARRLSSWPATATSRYTVDAISVVLVQEDEEAGDEVA